MLFLTQSGVRDNSINFGVSPTSFFFNWLPCVDADNTQALYGNHKGGGERTPWLMMTQHRHLYTKYRNEWERNSYHRNVKLDAVGSIVPRFDDKQSSRQSPAAVCLFPLKFQFHSTFIFVFVFVSIVVWSASRGGRKSRVNVYAFSWKISQHAWIVAWITDYLQKHKRAKNNRFSGRWIKERGEGIEWLRLLKRFDPVELCWEMITQLPHLNNPQSLRLWNVVF